MIKYKYILYTLIVFFSCTTTFAQNSPKTKIRLFEQTTVFDSVVNKNDSLYIYAGDTVFKTQISDADFYKVGTTLAPTNINDSIYTFGNVGIGTNTPTEKLHVKDGIALMNSNTDGGYLQFQYSGHSHKSEIGHISDIATGSIDWWGSNIESFDGVTQFSQPQKSLIGSASWYLQMSTLNSSSDYFSLNRIDKGNNYQEFVRVDSVGNVGIGTTVPSELLELQGGGIQLNDSMGIGFNGEIPHNSVNAGDRAKIYYNNNLFGTNVDGLVIEKTDDNNPVPDGGIAFINTGSTNVKDTALVIRGTGNVGINTPTPTNQLHIAGGTNPLRTEGLQPATANDTTVLVVDPTSGIVRYLDLDSIGGSDNDWYKQGTTSAPDDISDSIFTGGDVQLTNYPNTRGDDTTTHLNVLYTDVSGNIKSARREINPPAVALNLSTISTGNTFNYYNHYATQLTNALPVGLTPIAVGSLDFYVLYYDTAIFANVSISPVGLLTYDVIATSASHAVIDVRFYTK